VVPMSAPVLVLASMSSAAGPLSRAGLHTGTHSGNVTARLSRPSAGSVKGTSVESGDEYTRHYIECRACHSRELRWRLHERSQAVASVTKVISPEIQLKLHQKQKMADSTIGTGV